MDATLSLAAFEDELGRLLLLKTLIGSHKWRIQRVPNEPTIKVVMTPSRRPELGFTIRLHAKDYPEHSPSLQFVDAATGATGFAHWPPQGEAFRAAITRDQNLPQLCIRGIREFHEGCHNNDAARPWDPTVHTFAAVLERVQLLLNEAYP